MARTFILQAFGLQISCLSPVFRFRLYAFIKPAALCSIVRRYDHTGAPTATRVPSFFPFVSLDMSLFPSILFHCRFLFVWRVRRTFFPSAWCFSTLSPRAGFFNISLRENSIDQSITQSINACHASRQPHAFLPFFSPFFLHMSLFRIISIQLRVSSSYGKFVSLVFPFPERCFSLPLSSRAGLVTSQPM